MNKDNQSSQQQNRDINDPNRNQAQDTNKNIGGQNLAANKGNQGDNRQNK